MTDKIYVANRSNSVTVIDGPTNTTTSVPAGTQPTPAPRNRRVALSLPTAIPVTDALRS